MTGGGLVRIDDSRLRPEGASSLLFDQPHHIITANRLDEVSAALVAVDEATRQGYYAAGFIAYEAGYAFEPRLAALDPATDAATPLVWFGIYEAPHQLGFDEAETLWTEAQGDVAGFTIDCHADDFDADIARIHDLIAAGEVYQINHTIRSHFQLNGEARGLYARLRGGQRSPHAAFIETDDFAVLSLSPELFLEKQADLLRTRPMKGTAPRGRFASEDQRLANALQADEKSRAENLMIVDLLRNDLARVCEPASVTVPDLFTVEHYPSLMTMTSTVEGRIDPAARLCEIMPKLFPCGSVTGAPKIHAMELIHSIEQSPRGIYTGAVGMVTPQGDFHFNVAIRTAVIDANGNGTLGIGAGIVADSIAKDEFQECALKARFLTNPQPGFELFETTKWLPGTGYYLQDRHVARLASSAAFFGLPLNEDDLRALLDDHIAQFGNQPTRVRFALSDTGALSLSHRRLEEADTPAQGQIGLAPTPLDASNRFVFHKTSQRGPYNDAMKQAQQSGLLDLIFCNQKGFVTEGARTNIYIEKDGTLLTPPVTDGLLPGTVRADLLAQGRAQEAQLTIDDLRHHPCFISNSVMGLVPVKLAD